jgi:hypothetical protein
MQIIPMLVKEMDQEAKTTRKMLERVPAEKFEWQPHPKSMSLRRLDIPIPGSYGPSADEGDMGG